MALVVSGHAYACFLFSELSSTNYFVVAVVVTLTCACPCPCRKLGRCLYVPVRCYARYAQAAPAYQQQQQPAYGQPVAGYGQPVAGYGQPVAGYGQPVAGYGQPVQAYAHAQPTSYGVQAAYRQPVSTSTQYVVTGKYKKPKSTSFIWPVGGGRCFARDRTAGELLRARPRPCTWFTMDTPREWC